LRLIDFVYHSTLGLRVITKRSRTPHLGADDAFDSVGVPRNINVLLLPRAFRPRIPHPLFCGGAGLRVPRVWTLPLFCRSRSRFRVQGSGFRVQGSGFRVEG